jgi:hypothetical protein
MGLLIDLRLGRLVASALLLMVGMVIGAMAQATPEGATTADRPISFDIPSQPLASALESYSAATGREVLYNSNLIRDRKSRSLAGALNPDAALERLLDGTGLSPRYLADRSSRTVNFPIVAPSSRHGGIPESTFRTRGKFLNWGKSGPRPFRPAVEISRNSWRKRRP